VPGEAGEGVGAERMHPLTGVNGPARNLEAGVNRKTVEKETRAKLEAGLVKTLLAATPTADQMNLVNCPNRLLRCEARGRSHPWRVSAS
jgi:hypothetical protein